MTQLVVGCRFCGRSLGRRGDQRRDCTGQGHGTHIVTKRLFEHGKAYFCQGRDGRILLAIPYESEFTLIGTGIAERIARTLWGFAVREIAPDEAALGTCFGGGLYEAELR